MTESRTLNTVCYKPVTDKPLWQIEKEIADFKEVFFSERPFLAPTDLVEYLTILRRLEHERELCLFHLQSQRSTDQ